MADGNCKQCGASASGMVCEYCGSLLRSLADIEEEKRALERLHHYMQEADRSKQIRLLRNGFLPEHEETIIAAGLRCIPFINNAEILNEPRESAELRLRMIVNKLKLMPPSMKLKRAISQFQTILQSSARAEFWYLVWGIVIVVLVAGLLVGGYYLFVK
jgi:hypothetical protein